MRWKIPPSPMKASTALVIFRAKGAPTIREQHLEDS